MVSLENSAPSAMTQTSFSALPTELMIEIYAYSLNPCLQSVTHRLRLCLNTESARLSFSASAFSSHTAAYIGMAKAYQLQKWLLRKDWFTDRFAASVEKTIIRDYASTTSIMPSGGARVIEVPSRLLEGTWYDERLNLLERLMRWGAYIPATPPILDKIPERILKQAIAQRNRRALSFCMYEIRVKAHPQIWEFDRLTHGGKALTWFSSNCDNRGIGSLNWDLTTLFQWAEAKAQEGDAQGEWLLDVLSEKFQPLIEILA